MCYVLLPCCLFGSVCDMPESPLHGNTTMSADEQIIQYSCDTGYTLVGDVVRECQTDGTGWSGSDPSCSK